MFLSVAMATAEGASIPKVAEELGISDQTLRNWIKQKTTDTPLAPTNGKVDDESMKLLGLETESFEGSNASVATTIKGSSTDVTVKEGVTGSTLLMTLRAAVSRLPE